ncbi:unnamed protein product [Adineta ricciae]|uniref:Methyltransferase type 11 domain-containing protein n=1 Tax=Adineta ricciae TaxID=249248 RepID=A0A815R126_ADIRI|nr:unnamed protein product [Adineta ricciae]CAF1470446.1 unnamed protein product [Adineta ricciae]
MYRRTHVFLLIISTVSILSLVTLIVFHENQPQRPQPSRTCLKSANTEALFKVPFFPMMVHTGNPSKIYHWVRNKTGLEIGGPSPATWGVLGIYEAAAILDVTNFAATTLWEKELRHNSPFMWNNRRKGTQYIRDAVDLKGIPNNTYDFVIGSHVLEHIANPFKAFLEWLRILKDGGLLLLILPLKERTFDHNRAVASIQHLIHDYHKQVDESDLSHMDEIIRLHDLAMDPPAGNIEFFTNRSRNNFRNRGLHQHVYDQQLLYYMFICVNINVKYQITWESHQLIVGQKHF